MFSLSLARKVMAVFEARYPSSHKQCYLHKSQDLWRAGLVERNLFFRLCKSCKINWLWIARFGFITVHWQRSSRILSGHASHSLLSHTLLKLYPPLTFSFNPAVVLLIRHFLQALAWREIDQTTWHQLVWFQSQLLYTWGSGLCLCCTCFMELAAINYKNK